MNIAFTLCSNNYLAQAKTVNESFLKFHPEFEFFIGLVDKLPLSVNKNYFKDLHIILVEELNIQGFDNLHKQYTLTELNTAVKPSYFNYFFSKHNADKVIYIDPDVLVTSRFEEVLDALNEKNIIVTPHITKPIDDEFAPTDYHNLKVGIFNLGFIALSNHKKVQEFIKWWHDRVVKYGFANFSLHMFYDQLWANYIPCFYDNYCILKHPGYNMANWNLHERMLSENENGNYLVNNQYALRFFHFSSYSYKNPDIICSYFTRYSFEQRPDLINLFDFYQQQLLKNNVEEISRLPVYYYPELHNKKNNNDSYLHKLQWRLSRSFQILLKGK